MSKMSNLFLDIQELLEGTDMSFKQIAETLDIPLDMVYDVAESLEMFDE